MTVWVEAARWPRGKYICGHLMGDRLEQLHALAKEIELDRRWFNAHAPVPHYSIPEHLVAAAVAAGAVELSSTQRDGVLHRVAAACRAEPMKPSARGPDRIGRRRKGQEQLFES